MRWEAIRASAGCSGGGRRGSGGGQQQQQLPPGCKWGHTCNAVRNLHLIYVFGGYGRDECQTNDVHVFDMAKGIWSKPSMKGTLPSARDSHSCTTVGSKLYVFGGTDGTNPLDDLYVLDTGTNTWTRPEVSGEVPAAREGHCAALINDSLFVFGGCGKARDGSDEVYFNDLYALNTTTFVWKNITTAGDPPLPRDSHTCSSYKNNFIVLGGEDADNAYLADVHILDTETLVWRELKTIGAKLMPRAGHTTISHGKHLVVFGGFTDDRKLFNDLHVLDLLTGVWTKATPTGYGPSPRFSLAGDCVDSDRGILFFYGGCNEELEALDDMFYLDTEMPREKDPSEPKLSMRKELKRRRQECRASPILAGKHRDTENSLALSHQVADAHVQPMAEKIFEAKVSDVFHYGYTLEASIDGKLFRGLLFSYKPGFAQAVQSYLDRKKSGCLSPSQDARTEKMKVARAKQVTKRSEANMEYIESVNRLQQIVGTSGTEIASHSSPDSFEENHSANAMFAVQTLPSGTEGARLEKPSVET